VRLALIQTTLEYANPQSNIARLRGLIAQAVAGQADILVLPEMWNTSYALSQLADLADREGQPAASAIAQLAAKYRVNIVAGSVSDCRQGSFFNTAYVFDRQGRQVACYNKAHLFGLMKEDQYLTPGQERVTFELEGISCGIIICYDLRFPELSRALALDGAELLFVPAQWPKPRLHPWRTLLQARALENQLFVAAVNRVGTEGQASFFGHSMVVSPLGEIISEGSEEEEILYADIDLEEIIQVRARMNCLGDRNPTVY